MTNKFITEEQEEFDKVIENIEIANMEYFRVLEEEPVSEKNEWDSDDFSGGR